MPFTLDPEVAAVLAAAGDGPPPTPTVGDVASRRVALDAMLDHFNNQVQPPVADVDTVDYEVIAPDGTALLARWYQHKSRSSEAAALYLHGGG
jgi:acetyl esterase/lipase